MSCFWSLSHSFPRCEKAFFKSCFSSFPAPEIKHSAREADLKVEGVLQKSPQTLFSHRKQGVKEVTGTMGKLPLKSHVNPKERLKSIQFEARWKVQYFANSLCLKLLYSFHEQSGIGNLQLFTELFSKQAVKPKIEIVMLWTEVTI